MKHHVRVYEFFADVAAARQPLPIIEEFDVEAPDGDDARKVVKAEAEKRSGRVMRGLSHLQGGGFAVIVCKPELLNARTR